MGLSSGGKLVVTPEPVAARLEAAELAKWNVTVRGVQVPKSCGGCGADQGCNLRTGECGAVVALAASRVVPEAEGIFAWGGVLGEPDYSGAAPTTLAPIAALAILVVMASL